ncbi:5694_t:CDS:2 [Dentiscutata heterogama]|uniref:5694_t:CDS:1 n=1 Tax=Dentiscutata heterogama TaxID=1316150 RepID=A0ACA9LNN5_9GLOM|nr:5694_t:CDS:2 [Dentiscutata heterogama]
METFINLSADYWIRFLGGKCIDKCIQNNNHLISKFSLLSIIFENFAKLSESHPTLIASSLSKIGFVVPSDAINQKSISSHLSSYGKYYYLSKTSYLDILTSMFWDRCIVFQNCFQVWFPNFRNLFAIPIINYINYYGGHNSTILAIPLPNFVSYPKDYNPWLEFLLPSPNPFTYSNKLEVINELRTQIMDIQNGKWLGFKKPFFSRNLKKVLSLHDEQPSHEQIEEAIKNLSILKQESIKDMKKINNIFD